MAEDNFIGEIRMFGGSTPPAGWTFCNGQLLSISGNETLFTLLGTTYGGDGQTNFGLPDLRGRVPIGMDAGSTYPLGQMDGAEQVTLNVPNLPAHGHSAGCSNVGGVDTPKGNIWANATDSVYAPADSFPIQMSSLGVSMTGSGKPHDNVVPFLCVSFIIALAGIFPSRS